MIFIFFEKRKKLKTVTVQYSWNKGANTKNRISHRATINAVDDAENWSREEDTKDGIPGRRRTASID